MNPDQAEAVTALLRRGALLDDDGGPSLAEMRRARVPLTDAEAVTVAVPLAETLDALRDAGLAYGPPGPGDVRFLPGGRPALVVPRRWADEPDDDVPGLLRTVLAVMTPPLPPADDDVPDLRPVLEDLLACGCRSGAEVVRACFTTVSPEPVRIPDAGALARAGLVDPRAWPGGRAIGRDLRRCASLREPTAARAGAAVTSGPSRRAVRRRARRRARLRTVAVVAVATALVGGLLLRPATDRATAGQVPSTADRAAGQVTSPAGVAIAPSAAGGAVDPVVDRTAPAAAAAALTRQRAAVIGAGDAAGLAAVDAPGGSALDADEDLLASLDGDRLDGLSVDVQATDLVEADPDAPGVAVTSAMSPYRRLGGSGTAFVPGAAPRTVMLHLRWTAVGWRVWSVEEGAAAAR